MHELVKKKCTPCVAGVTSMGREASLKMKDQLDEGWNIIDDHRLEKEYKLKNFQQALELTCDIGKVAEEQAHHPVITLGWGSVKLAIWTHKINGLTESDFILAAKCDACYISRFGK